MRMQILVAALLVLALTAPAGCARRSSEGPTAPPATTATAGATATTAAEMSLTATERVRVAQAVTTDARVRAIVGARPRVIVGEPILEEAQLERYVRVQAAPPPTREVPAILFNVQTNRAASAFATAEGRVLAVEAISAQLVPFTVEDAAAAFDLVRR